MNKNFSYATALELAFGKGRQKKWAYEAVLLDALYESKDKSCYIKLEDISDIKGDIETEEEIILRYGFIYRLPRTEIQLHIIKKTHQVYLSKEGMGFGYDDVEEKILEFMSEQKKKANLIYQSNFNEEEFKIK